MLFFWINVTSKSYSVIIEVTSLQTTVVSKNKQVVQLQSKLEKKDEIVRILQSMQERKSYVTLQLN